MYFEILEDNVGRFTCTGSKWISGSLENLSPGLESFRHSWWGSQLAPSRNSPNTSTPFSGAWLPCKDCNMGSLSSKKILLAIKVILTKSLNFVIMVVQNTRSRELKRLEIIYTILMKGIFKSELLVYKILSTYLYMLVWHKDFFYIL